MEHGFIDILIYIFTYIYICCHAHMYCIYAYDCVYICTVCVCGQALQHLNSALWFALCRGSLIHLGLEADAWLHLFFPLLFLFLFGWWETEGRVREAAAPPLQFKGPTRSKIDPDSMLIHPSKNLAPFVMSQRAPMPLLGQ